MEILVFGGTSEGRALVEWLDARGTSTIVACTATSYGARLIEGGLHVTVHEGPLSAEAKQALVDGHDFSCIVDATHPYARHITESVEELGRATGIDVVRIVRENAEEGPWTSAADASAAARHLAQTEGNILLTTGSKDLATFTQLIPAFEERLYLRVLPMAAALERVGQLGIPASHVVAMQGPFSVRLNEALIEEFAIRHLVTKQSGRAGGFDEKVAAAQACGIELVVIERPYEERGVSLDEAKALLEERYGL